MRSRSRSSPAKIAHVAACWSLAMIGAQGQLGISEFVAANTTGLVDEDGDHSDWMELVNLGEELVDLDGWHLTDDVEDPEKWALPAIAMAPGERRIVFASGKNRRETDGEWHANFRLSREGEFLALRHPNGEWVGAFAPHYPEQIDDVSYGEGRYWPSPSPGMPNELAANDPPFLVAQSHEPAIPQEGEDVTITARLQEGGGGIAAATLVTRIMYRPESSIPLEDDGQEPDLEAGDGVYSATVPARTLFGSRYAAGEMIRWAVVVIDHEGVETRFPPLSESRPSAEYFGTVVFDPDAESALPVLHWFVEDERGATSTTGSRASALFDGQFYDNFFVRRRGQFGAIDWAKPKIKFDFNPGDHFRHRPDRRRVEEFNLQSHYVDSSYMRENVAFAFFNEAGTPAPFTQHWHVRRNGAYYGLFSFIEQVDEDFLIQHDLDPEGVMYKANGFPSTLAVGVTPALYQKETHKEEPYDDLVAFVDGINGIGVERSAYVMDHVDLPAVINEMACHTILHNADRLTKNYYIYQDPETDRWRRMPWDLDGAFGSGGSLDTENFASPLYGDSEHTQAPGQAIYQNFLLDAILDDPVMREIYLRRLRTLMDRYLSPESDYFPSRLRHYLQLIEDEATRDAQKWGRSNVRAGVEAIIHSALPNRWRQLTETYGPPGQGLVPEKQSAGLEPSIGSLDYRPEDPLAEYIELINPHTEAIDLSGWRLEGAIAFEFPAGTVVPRRGTILQPGRGRLFVVRDHRAFRRRQSSPRGGEGHLVVGPYKGQILARGETIQLYNLEGELSAEKSFEGDPEDLLTYAFALGAPGGHLPIVSIREGRAVVRFTRWKGASDLGYVVETSIDMVEWLPAADDAVEVYENGADLELVETPIPTDLSGSRFLRVAVELSGNR